MKILMVCLGNICRSPLAEGILKKKIMDNTLDWIVDSAGTAGYHVGEAPHHLSQKIALENGINISSQVCRQLQLQDLELFDMLYVMDKSNYSDVIKLADGNNIKKVKLIMDELYPSENREVPDPWHGGIQDFRNVFNILEEVCQAILKKHSKI